jgi:hypothetical protein
MGQMLIDDRVDGIPNEDWIRAHAAQPFARRFSVALIIVILSIIDAFWSLGFAPPLLPDNHVR